MEDSLADPLLDAIATALLPSARPCPTRHLAIAPPYDWSRTYMAAKDMEEYLPGVPLDATLVEATEDGFDVLASDGVTSLVHVVVERRRHQPLRPGDPVVATVAGVGLEGDLLREGRPGEWVVRARTGGDQQPVEEITVTASDVTFSWRVGCAMWMKAVRLAPLRLAARKADWLGIGSLELEIYGSPRALSAGDPAALFGLQDEPELNGQGVTLLEKLAGSRVRVHGLASKPELNGSVGEVEGPALGERVFVRLDAPHSKTVSLNLSNLEELGSSDGRWRIRLERLGDGDAPKEHVVSAAAIGALPNWPFLGVSVACLRAFARAHEALLVDATTEDVCERVCKPLTETAGDSLAACLVRLGAVDPVTGVPWAAAPTIFVSHARKYLFRDLVDAVCAHVSSLPEEEHERQYVWLDIFSQYQHWIGDVGTAQRPCNWDVVFQLTTAAIGHTCLIFAPWRDAVPLRRAWMLWEVLCTLTAQGKKGAASSTLRVRLPPAESGDFQAALVDEFDVIASSVARIDSRSAECFTLEDQAMVHAAIDRTLKGGHTELDALLSEALREWLAAEGRAALARMPREKRATSALQRNLGTLLQAQGNFDEAEPLYREALKAMRATLGDRHPRTLTSIDHLGVLLLDQGKLDEAKPLLGEALEARRATLGDRHPHTHTSMNNLGTLLIAQGKKDEALPLYRKAVEGRRAMLGNRDSDTLKSMGNLGILLQELGKLDEAEPLLREVREARRATLGDRHPFTLASMNNLGTLLHTQGKNASIPGSAMANAQGKLDEAEPLYRKALEARRATLGDRHPDTLTSIGNLGHLLKDQGKLDEAESLLREALEAFCATLGDRHHFTLTSLMNLGGVLHKQGKLNEAEPLYRKALEVQRETLGDRHPQTFASVMILGQLLQDQGKMDEALPLKCEALEAMRACQSPHLAPSIENLAARLQKQGKIDDALPLWREALEVRRATLGDRHPHTLALMDFLGGLLEDEGKLDEALPLFVEHSRATLGDQHPETLQFMNKLKALELLKVLELKRAPLIGKPVLVHGLVSKPELNNRTGTAAGWDEERGRYSVRLQDGSLLALMPANLRQLDTAQEPQTGTKSVPGTARSSSSPDPSAGGFVGKQVLVHGLVAKQELNNRTGTAAGWDSERGRYTVRLQDGSTVALKPANLRKL